MLRNIAEAKELGNFKGLCKYEKLCFPIMTSNRQSHIKQKGECVLQVFLKLVIELVQKKIKGL